MNLGRLKDQLMQLSLRWRLTVFAIVRHSLQTFLVLLVDEREEKLGVTVIYEALDAGNLAKCHAKWARPLLHPGEFLVLIYTTRIGDSKAAIHTRELQTALRYEVLSESVLGVMQGYRWVQMVISMGR